MLVKLTPEVNFINMLTNALGLNFYLTNNTMPIFTSTPNKKYALFLCCAPCSKISVNLLTQKLLIVERWWNWHRRRWRGPALSAAATRLPRRLSYALHVMAKPFHAQTVKTKRRNSWNSCKNKLFRDKGRWGSVPKRCQFHRHLSSSFFHLKVLFTDFLKWQFVFVFFLAIWNGWKKAARKMLVMLTTILSTYRGTLCKSRVYTFWLCDTLHFWSTVKST